MKTTAPFLISVALFLAGPGYANAQSAAQSNKEVHPIENNAGTVPQTIETTISEPEQPDRGIPMPPHIEKLFMEGKTTEALNAFNTFKATQKKANPFHLLYLEMTVYEHARMNNPTNSQYAEKIKTLRQEIIEKYPNESDAYLLLIENGMPDEKIVELATKALEIDPENIGAYNYRGHALFNLGRTKEACQDFEKLPQSMRSGMPEYWQCKDLK